MGSASAESFVVLGELPERGLKMRKDQRRESKADSQTRSQTHKNTWSRGLRITMKNPTVYVHNKIIFCKAFIL